MMSVSSVVEPVARPQGVRKAWAQGIAAVAARRICAHVVGFGAGIVLARLLRPADFGIYFIANSFVTMLGTLQTTNMSGALIQSREAPSKEDEATLFTLEQALALAGIAIVGLAGIAIYALPRFAPARTVFPYVFALSLIWFISGFGFVPNIRLTRSLQYGRISLADGVAETSFY